MAFQKITDAPRLYVTLFKWGRRGAGCHQPIYPSPV